MFPVGVLPPRNGVDGAADDHLTSRYLSPSTLLLTCGLWTATVSDPDHTADLPESRVPVAVQSLRGNRVTGARGSHEAHLHLHLVPVNPHPWTGDAAFNEAAVPGSLVGFFSSDEAG
jgi:hypothetical protein